MARKKSKLIGEKMKTYDFSKKLKENELLLNSKFNNKKLTNIYGTIKSVLGNKVEAVMPKARIGDLCKLIIDDNDNFILSEVIGFKGEIAILSTLKAIDGISYNSKVIPMYFQHKIALNNHVFGKVYDGVGYSLNESYDDIICLSKITDSISKKVISDAIQADNKLRIDSPLLTGIKSIDSLLTLGCGQRIGLFAGAGCGKTTLLASLARGCSADSIVFALIGERGRELNEFLEHELDEDLKKRSILVCATSDKSAMERSRAAFTATAIAESLRDQGQQVLLLVDSLTRFARAQREIGLSSGEPLSKSGFPPSVYSMLPKLIERAGKTKEGSITAIYTLLLEGDSMIDPIADEAKSLLDGHIVLSRKLAEKSHYPAVDVLKSLSRTMTNVVKKDHILLANNIRLLLSQYEDVEMLIRLGEYNEGVDEATDLAVELNPSINEFLKQGVRDFLNMMKLLL